MGMKFSFKKKIEAQWKWEWETNKVPTPRKPQRAHLIPSYNLSPYPNLIHKPLINVKVHYTKT
jgi:hypothetical protein